MNKILIASLITVLFVADVAGAGETYTLSISCSIPAIPGVNAPLTEEAAPRVEGEKATLLQEAKGEEEEQKISSPEMIQEETQKEASPDSDKTTSLALQTFYSR